MLKPKKVRMNEDEYEYIENNIFLFYKEDVHKYLLTPSHTNIMNEKIFTYMKKQYIVIEHLLFSIAFQVYLNTVTPFVSQII